jgi:fumarate reductase subunit C
MRENPSYTPYHPSWLRRPVSTYWWLERPTYVAFILREISSVFVAWSVVFVLLLVRAVGQGDDAYRQFLAWAATPAIASLNVVSLLFVLFHAMTWFNLAPSAMVVHLGGRKLPGVLIAGANYGGLVVASALIGWLLLGA